jgi:hypothetical protein
MDYVGVTEIPKKHILKQWMRDARNLLPEHLRHCVTRLLEKNSRRGIPVYTYKQWNLLGRRYKCHSL